MTNENLQLQKIHTNLSDLIKSKADAIPKGFNETRFIQNAMTVLADTKNLDKMNPQSVARTILKGAFLGLDFFSSECFAIPYGEKLTFQTSYKGEKKLAKKYSIRKINEIYAKTVRKGDGFETGLNNGEQYVNFKPKGFSEEQIVGVFAVCQYEDGGFLVETMTTSEVNDVRNKYSKVPNGPAWSNRWGEMAKKTVIKLLCKGIEIEFDSTEATKAFKAGSPEFTNFEDISTVEAPIATPKSTEPNSTGDTNVEDVGKFIFRSFFG